MVGLSVSRSVSEGLEDIVAPNFLRRRAECFTLASHLAEARCHIRCLERTRCASSLSCELAVSLEDDGSSASDAFFRRFLLHKTMPIMKAIKDKARERERPSMMPVMSSLDLLLPQPWGRVGPAEVEVDVDEALLG